MGVAEDLQKVDLVVGRVVAADEHAGARAPSLVVKVDLGPRGRRETTVPATAGPDELVGR